MNFKKLTEKLNNNENIEIICECECDNNFIGDVCYMLRTNEYKNVYRVFVGVNGLVCVQCVMYALTINGVEYFDDSRDFWCGTVEKIASLDLSDDIYTTIEMCVNTCDKKFGASTVYEK
jgi:hypothetical protein